MLKLSVNDIVKHNENCYSFVVAVAKRAREISEQAEEEDILLDKQPVQMAVKEFVEGKFHIEESPEAKAALGETEGGAASDGEQPDAQPADGDSAD